MFGHEIANCIDLKEQVEWLVQNQYLKKYVNNQIRDKRKEDIKGSVAIVIIGAKLNKWLKSFKEEL